MEELMKLIENVEEERKQIIDELEQLRKKSIVKRFLELNEKNHFLVIKQKELIKQFKLKEFNSCQHLWIITKSDYDNIEGRTQRYYGCIKCGLNQEVLNKVNYISETKYLNFEEQIMYNYLKKGIYMPKGSVIPVSCDIDLAKTIYSKIKENNPDIDDETSRKYFEITLDNITKNKSSENNKENKKKRLLLNSNFNKSNGGDIEN